MEQLGILALVLVQLLHVVEESLIDADLNELFERHLVVWFVLQVDVGFLGDEQVCLREVLLVLCQLFLEERDVTSSVFLTQVTKLCLMLVLHLCLLITKVLLLGLDDDMQLCLLTLDLLDQLLQIGNLLEVLDLLRGDLLVE